MSTTITRTNRHAATNRKLNRSQKLLTAEQARRLPPLYSTDGQGDAAVVHVKFFLGAYTWYATEYDPETGTFFCMVDNYNMRDQLPEGELGYVNAEELCTVTARVNVGGFGSFRQPVERDLHWQPKTLGEIRDKLNPARKIADSDRDAVAEFDAVEPVAEPAAAEPAAAPKSQSTLPADKVAAKSAKPAAKPRAFHAVAPKAKSRRRGQHQTRPRETTEDLRRIIAAVNC